MGKETGRYFQPDTLDGIEAYLAEMTEHSVILAGGTDLLVSVRKNRPQIDTYLSLCCIPELRRICREGPWLKIGAMVTHSQAEENAEIKRYFRALSMACGGVGSKQVRNKGTLGGNLMNGSPAGDIIPCVWLFNGELEFITPDGRIRMAFRDFLAKKKRQAMPNALLVAIWLPLSEEEPPKDSCFWKLGGREEVTIAQISMAASWRYGSSGKEAVELVLGAVDLQPVSGPWNSLLEGPEISAEAKEAAAGMMREAIADIRKRRARAPKLKITEAEKLYKERAVKGLLFDVIQDMNQRRG